MLSRDQAQLGIYPTVDIPSSISRVMNEIVSPEHISASVKLRQLVTTYIENKDLLMMGGYSQGQDQTLDSAVALWPQITDFISQNENQKEDFKSSSQQLIKLFSG